MTKKTNPPKYLSRFVTDLRAALANNLIGVILFGSRANGRAGEGSDYDIAVVVADVSLDQARILAERTVETCGLDRSKVALSVEGFLRIKQFLELGDPFVWVILRDGKIISDSSSLLKGLQSECRQPDRTFEATATASYLKNKCSLHYDQAMSALHEFFANQQLSVMAGAQASVLQHRNRLTPVDIINVTQWPALRKELASNAVTPKELDQLERLVMAHKTMGKPDGDPATTEMFDAIQHAGRVWQRLGTQSRKTE